MMGCQLSSPFGEEPSSQLTQVLLKGVSLAPLHGPHNTLLVPMQHRQQPLSKAAHMHALSLVYMHIHVQASSLT